MKILPFICIYPDLTRIENVDEFFNGVKENFNNYKKQGLFNVASKAIYVYKIITENSSFIGFVAANDLSEREVSRIKKHEKTLAKKEKRLLSLTIKRKAQIKPVLLGYEKSPIVDDLIESIIVTSPFLSIALSKEKEKHLIWRITDKEVIKTFQKVVSSNILEAFIADGHHRFFTSLLLQKKKRETNPSYSEKLLSVYFPFSQLKIYDYNRIVDLTGICAGSELLERLKDVFEVTKSKNRRKPDKKHMLKINLTGIWYDCFWKQSILNKYIKEKTIIDTHLFNQEILKNILRIKAPQNSRRLTYVAGPDGVKPIEKVISKNQNFMGVLLVPVTVQELKITASNNLILPAKSTWFEPRIKNGLFGIEVE